MTCRAGITTRPQERKNEWKQKYPSMYNWQVTSSFDSREDAQKWEDAQPCEKHGGGDEPANPLATWYGYRFDY